MEFRGRITIFDHSVAEGATVINEAQTLMAVAVARRINQGWTTRSANTHPQRVLMIGDVAVYTVEHDDHGEPIQGEIVMETQTWSVNNIRHSEGENIVIDTIIRSPFDRQESTRNNPVNVNLSKYLGPGIKELCAKAMTKAAKELQDNKGISHAIPEQYKDLRKIAISMAKSSTTENGEDYTNPMAQAIVEGNALEEIMNNSNKE